jgi:hypothetical protein
MIKLTTVTGDTLAASKGQIFDAERRPDCGKAIKRPTHPSKPDQASTLANRRGLSGVPDRVADIPMAVKILNEPGFQPFVSEHVTDAEVEHVGMDAEPNAGRLSSFGDDPCNGIGADRAAPIGDEEVWSVSDLPP